MTRRDRASARKWLMALVALGAVPHPLAAQGMARMPPAAAPTAEDYADCRGEKAGTIVRHTDAGGPVVKRCTPSSRGLVALPLGAPAPPAPPPQAGSVYTPVARDYVDCRGRKNGMMVRSTAAAGGEMKRCTQSARGLVAVPMGSHLPLGSR